MTLVTALVIAALVFSEFMYYRTIDIKYTYYVDPDIHREMFLTLDITVAMKCDREAPHLITFTATLSGPVLSPGGGASRAFLSIAACEEVARVTLTMQPHHHHGP